MHKQDCKTLTGVIYSRDFEFQMLFKKIVLSKIRINQQIICRKLLLINIIFLYSNSRFGNARQQNRVQNQNIVIENLSF